MPYQNDLNHQQWLETVPLALRPLVPAAIEAWDAQADNSNKWGALGWDERDALLLQAQTTALAALSEYIPLTEDLRARVISDPARGPLVLELEEREEAGLGGYRFGRTYVSGRPALAALADLLQVALAVTPTEPESLSP